MPLFPTTDGAVWLPDTRLARTDHVARDYATLRIDRIQRDANVPCALLSVRVVPLNRANT